LIKTLLPLRIARIVQREAKDAGRESKEFARAVTVKGMKEESKSLLIPEIGKKYK